MPINGLADDDIDSDCRDDYGYRAADGKHQRGGRSPKAGDTCEGLVVKNPLPGRENLRRAVLKGMTVPAGK